MKWSIIVALGIAIFGFIPLMGIPGAIVLSIGELCAEAFKVDLLCMKGDHAWPAAILATWIWPVTIPISCFLSFRLWKAPATSARWGLFLVLLLIGALIVSTGVELLARQEQKSATSQNHDETQAESASPIGA
ncbi:MAG: hypothetical protein K2W95_06305 [Candidatus Obscuribacterales bacterium]|nr:hypothetical protein [Candidatus Obscuribacterales bacterium]